MHQLVTNLTNMAKYLGMNKIKTDPLRAVKTLMRKEMGLTAVSTIKVSSVTLKIWQNGAKENYYNFATFNRIVDTKTSII